VVYPALRAALFRLDAERAHRLTTGALGLAQHSRALLALGRRAWAVSDPRLEQHLLGRRFANPVGLAAGFDKDARWVPALAAMGFGALEVGTVTPRPQPGNPRPRLWRHPRARSLQNSLGFNSNGMAAVAANLDRLAVRPVPIGINLGKNRQTAAADAAGDYEELLSGLSGRADYFVLNVSSPNTPGLRDLQARDFIHRVLAAAAGITAAPVLIKIAPDMPRAAAVELAEEAVAAGAAGVIATNTTTDYGLIPGVREVGGLSGAVLRERSFAMLQALGRALAGRTCLISVGGIDSAAEAYRRLRAGASLVQLYTALVYEGPALVGRINRGLIAALERDGLSSLSAAIGADL
jgi:dihydroorotate dehydrogenase